MSKNGEMSFLEHLEQLRWHIVRSVCSIAVFSVVAFLFKHIIFDQVLFGPKNLDFITYRLLCKISGAIGLGDVACIDKLNFIIQNRTMSGQFSSHIWASFITGIIVAFPYVIWEFWRFLAPGMTAKEKKYSRGMVYISSFLFMMGVCFGYFLITPLSIQFLANYSVSQHIANEIDLSSYISTVCMIVLAAGMVFQLPILVYFLSKIGLISPELMRKYRKHATIGVFILSAIITPPDISSQILVSIPILFLYQISIHISKSVIKKENSI